MELTLPQQALYFLLVAPLSFYFVFWLYEDRKRKINIRLAIFSQLFGITAWAAITLLIN